MFDATLERRVDDDDASDVYSESCGSQRVQLYRRTGAVAVRGALLVFPLMVARERLNSSINLISTQ